MSNQQTIASIDLTSNTAIKLEQEDDCLDSDYVCDNVKWKKLGRGENAQYFAEHDLTAITLQQHDSEETITGDIAFTTSEANAYSSQFQYNFDQIKVENNFNPSNEHSIINPTNDITESLNDSFTNDYFPDELPCKNNQIEEMFLKTNLQHKLLTKGNESILISDEVSLIKRTTPQEAQEKRYSCTVCNYKTQRKCDLVRHMLVHTKNQIFMCKLCEYKSARELDLKVHMRMHMEEKTFSCQSCGYRSQHKHHVFRHMRVHAEEHPSTCNLLESMQDLQAPLPSDAQEFSCNLCDYKTEKMSCLEQHVKIHIKDKVFACDFCEYKTFREHDIKAHVRAHKQKRTFSCVLCGYRTSQKFNIDRHMKAHLREDMFTCTLCSYRTVRERDFKAHQGSHLQDKRFSCGSCSYETKRKANLRRHLKTHERYNPD